MQQLLWAGQDWSGHEGLLPASLQPAWCPHGLLGVGCDTQQTRHQGLALWIPQTDGEMGSTINRHATARQGNAGCGIMQGGTTLLSGGLVLGKGIKGGL